MYIIVVNRENKNEFCKKKEYIMRGDVWVKENSNGEKVVCIDNGKFVSETVIKPVVKYKIKNS